MSEKPLHVKVAEALNPGARWEPPYYFHVEGNRHDNPPRYDTDWSATGPLIERLLPELIIYDRSRTEGAPGRKQAFVPGDSIEGWGETTLEAVCHLFLALHAKDRLNPKTNPKDARERAR